MCAAVPLLIHIRLLQADGVCQGKRPHKPEPGFQPRPYTRAWGCCDEGR